MTLYSEAANAILRERASRQDRLDRDARAALTVSDCAQREAILRWADECSPWRPVVVWLANVVTVFPHGPHIPGERRPLLRAALAAGMPRFGLYHDASGFANVPAPDEAEVAFEAHRAAEKYRTANEKCEL